MGITLHLFRSIVVSLEEVDDQSIRNVMDWCEDQKEFWWTVVFNNDEIELKIEHMRGGVLEEVLYQLRDFFTECSKYGIGIYNDAIAYEIVDGGIESGCICIDPSIKTIKTTGFNNQGTLKQLTIDWK